MISKYGYDVVIAVGLVVVLGTVISWYLIGWTPLKYGLIAIFLVFFLFTLFFFRDPERVTPPGSNLVIAPADGKIVLIRDVGGVEYIGGDAMQVSIFMSPLNVHVNRYPMAGKVGYFRHIPGEYIVAFDEKSSLRNERTEIGVENGGTRVLFKQIAGFIARRIVAEVKEGDRAGAGVRFGMIKFGSRVDVLMPRSMRLAVQVGDRTVAGETVLAEHV